MDILSQVSNVQVIILFIIYFLLALLPGCIIHSCIETIVGLPGQIFLSITTGICILLVSLSLFVRLTQHYESSLLISLFLIYSVRFVILKKLENHPQAPHSLFHFNPINLISAGFFAILFTALIFFRSEFSATYFDAARFGGEKLYNLQFIQSFLFASSYPPESLWLSGSPIGYYVLPKALAGVSARIALELFNNSQALGYLFHISDIFFISLGTCMLGGILSFVLRSFCDQNEQERFFFFQSSKTLINKKNSQNFHINIHVFSLLLALFPLFGIPGRTLHQAWQNKADLWSQSRIVENTINEFPFWNYLWADNHSHSAAIFMQMGAWFWLLIILFKNLDRKTHAWTFSALLGAFVTSALFMSHSGSIFIDLVIGFLLICTILVWALKNAKWEIFKFCTLRLITLAVLTFLLAAPDIMTRGQPNVLWYFVPQRLTTTMADFFNIYFSHLIFFIAFSLLCLISFRFSQADYFYKNFLKFKSQGQSKITQSKFILVLLPAIAMIVLALVGRQSWALSLLFALLILLSGPYKPLAIFSALGIFGFVFTPEFVASNFNMGEDYMRFNTLFRFLFEFYYFLPFFLVLTYGEYLVAILSKKYYFMAVSAALLVLCLISLWSLTPIYQLRKNTYPQSTPTLNGLEWLKKENPGDFAISQFLLRLSNNQIRIIEECGAPPNPTGYSYLGRISALSGRPALCGWTNHMLLFQKKFTEENFNKLSIWQNILERNDLIKSIYSLQPLTEKQQNLLEELKVTHIVFGEVEAKNHARTDLQKLKIYGTIAMQIGNLGVVEVAKH